MYKLKLILVFLSVLVSQFIFAQEDYLKRADKLYENGVYSDAAEIYLTYLQQTYDYDINLKLAECYREMNMTIEAEFWYEIIIQQGLASEDLILNYANLLKSNGKYKSAKAYYLKYGAYDDEGFYLASTCDWAMANEDKTPEYVLKNLNINTTGSDITPTFFKKGIIFSSGGGDEVNAGTGMPFYDLYYCEWKNDTTWSKTPLSKSVNSKYHEASPCYNPKDEVLYFTRNNHYKNRTIASKDKQVKLEMFYSDYIGNKFYAPKPMPFNSKNYSIGQSTISVDGSILIFASDKPGGYGGTDLYFVQKKGSGWSAIKNLGPVINSGGDELFPYLDPDGKLYFSSNYLPGFGGLDIFTAIREGDHWTVPQNAGKPLNSAADDFGVIMRNGKGFVTSNRAGGVGSDDIYTVSEAHILTTLYVYGANLKPISKARVTFVEGPKSEPICETDEYGMGDISLLKNSNMAIKISKEGYLDRIIYNIGSYRSNNGMFPVEMQPLIGAIENNNTQQSIAAEQINNN